MSEKTERSLSERFPKVESGRTRGLIEFGFNAAILIFLVARATEVEFISIRSLMGMFEFRLGGPMNYLTLWGLQFSIGTFLLKVLCSIFSNSPVLIDLEKVYRLLALAIEGVVLLAYWPLAIINPEMVVPPDVVITLSDDLLLHCYPGLLIYLHQIFLSKRLIDNSGLLKLQTLNSRKVHSNVFVILFGMFYTCWIEYSSTRFNPKVFPYPFLDIIFLGRYTIYISFLFIGLFLLRLSQPSS